MNSDTIFNASLQRDQESGDESGGSERAIKEEGDDGLKNVLARDAGSDADGGQGLEESAKAIESEAASLPAKRKGKEKRATTDVATGVNSKGRCGVTGTTNLLKMEPSLRSFGGMGGAGGALAVPLGTQVILAY